MSLEKEIFELWKEINPSTAFVSGIKECAGKLFIPTAENRTEALNKISKLKKRTNDKSLVKFLNCLETSLEFEEPPAAPACILNVIFNHLVKEGVDDKHIASIIENGIILLRVYKIRFTTDWPVEIKILTLNECNGLLGILESLKKQVKTKRLKESIDELCSEVDDYKKRFFVEGIDKGDFSEVYPILSNRREGIGRKEVYPKLLKDLYDYPESAKEIEQRALKFLEKDLPELQKVTKKLAFVYGVDPVPEEVAKAIEEKGNLKPSELLKVVKDIRKGLQKIAEERIVKITPKYDVRVIETPHYLVNFMPTAAMQPFDVLTKKPFNLFFVTTSELGSPAKTVSEITNTLIHEEYGHCVNFSNSAVGFAAKPSLVELLDTSLSTAITEGFAFYVECIEVPRLLEDPAFREALGKVLEKYGDVDTLMDEIVFSTCKWRIIRFLRAIGDSRVNSEKQSFYDFIEWAHEKTGINRKLIFDQLFQFQEHPGYAPNYSMFGLSLEEIKKGLQKKIKDPNFSINFNTYVSSLGFPPRTVFEKRLSEYAKRA